MNLMEKIDMFLMSEGKVIVSPYLKSVMGKQNDYSESEVSDITKKLSNTGVSASVAISVPYTKGGKYILVNSDDDGDIKAISGELTNMGYKVGNKKKDGGKTFVYFK